ncbi:MAG: hypothetical protein KDB71_13270 [Mycobacterium sp.]|nr:hypothetical protein [Mycobacterium sp.]
MKRALALSAAASLLGIPAPVATADPTSPGSTGVTYMIGRCYDPSQPVAEKPATVVYNCDSTSIMQEMSWTSWGADGADGTGMDNSVECKPNCAQGPHLYNPIIVHAWNPKTPTTPGCPPNVQFYTELTVAYPKGVPPWVKPGTSWSNTVDYIDVDGMPAVHFTDQGPYSCTPLGQ